jgi:hypothetical protein
MHLLSRVAGKFFLPTNTDDVAAGLQNALVAQVGHDRIGEVRSLAAIAGDEFFQLFGIVFVNLFSFDVDFLFRIIAQFVIGNE